MSINGSVIDASTTSPCHPWCTINHADPMFDLDCHVSEIDWTHALGLGLVTSDGSPVAVEASWNYGQYESVTWTPTETRQVAAALLRLADRAEKSAMTDAVARQELAEAEGDAA